MALSRWLYRKSDSLFLQGGGNLGLQPPLMGDPPLPDYTAYGVAEFADADQPSLHLHRYDAALGKRLATAQELADADDADTATRAQLTSRQRDILATVALIVRRSDPAAWTAMSAAQKKTAVLAAADQWRDLRVLVDKLV